MPDDVVLDLGCGQGLGARLISRSGVAIGGYVGLDLSGNMLRLAQLDNCAPAGLIQADMQAIPISDASINAVISLFGSASYVQQPRRMLEELARVLAPGGMFVIMCLSRWSLRRLLRFKLAGTGAYGTSGLRRGRAAQAHVRFTTKGLMIRDLREYDLVVSEVYGQSLFRARTGSVFLWRMSRSLGRAIPSLGHALIVVGKKSNTTDSASC